MGEEVDRLEDELHAKELERLDARHNLNELRRKQAEAHEREDYGAGRDIEREYEAQERRLLLLDREVQLIYRRIEKAQAREDAAFEASFADDDDDEG